MKKILFVTFGIVFLFACKNLQDNDYTESSKMKEEFIVNFSVDAETGGYLIAMIKDGKSIDSGAKVAKDSEVVFTAQPDATHSVEQWSLDGGLVAEAELKNGKKEYTLKITGDVNIVVKFSDNGGLKNIEIEKDCVGLSQYFG